MQEGHYFFVDLLFPAIDDDPRLLLVLRAVCRKWRALLSTPRYWTRMQRRLCDALPPLSRVFERQPAWRAFARLLAIRPDHSWRNTRDHAIRMAILWATHVRPQCIARMEHVPSGGFMVHYRCGRTALVTDTIVSAPSLNPKRLAFMHVIRVDLLERPSCTCAHHPPEWTSRCSSPSAAFTPFRRVVRNKRAVYATDETGVHWSYTRGHLFFED